MCDLLDIESLQGIFEKHQIKSVIHFAAMKAVGESMQFPLLYYKNNLIGMINLLEVSVLFDLSWRWTIIVARHMKVMSCSMFHMTDLIGFQKYDDETPTSPPDDEVPQHFQFGVFIFVHSLWRA
jgi:nucleoside-diphosphate-sugar epimerase